MGKIGRVAIHQSIYGFEADTIPRWPHAPTAKWEIESDTDHFRVGSNALRFTKDEFGIVTPVYVPLSPLKITGQRYLEIWRRINHVVQDLDINWQLWVIFHSGSAQSQFLLESKPAGKDEFYKTFDERYFTLDRESPTATVGGGVDWSVIGRISLRIVSNDLVMHSVTLDDLRYKNPSNVAVMRIGL